MVRPSAYWRQPAQWRPGYANAPWYGQRWNQNPFAPGGGTRDEQIRWIQHFLNRILNQNLPVDGVMSPATRTAVRKFQRRFGLPATGYVGPDTQQALVGTASSDSGMQIDPGVDMTGAAGIQGVDAANAPGGMVVGAPPQSPPGADADARELLEEYGLPGEFELRSEFENWESGLDSGSSRGRGNCHCHQPQADSSGYEFEGYDLDRESDELEGGSPDPEEIIFRGLPVPFRRDFDKFRLEVARAIGRWTIYRSDQGRRALKLATDNDTALRALHSSLLRSGVADGRILPLAAEFIYQGRGPGRHVKRVEMSGAFYGGEERIEIHDTRP
jgi:8-oxo-dGTP pyrophosphatase MutT (NUDIX family)